MRRKEFIQDLGCGNQKVRPMCGDIIKMDLKNK
jgi:hypothetical protein